MSKARVTQQGFYNCFCWGHSELKSCEVPVACEFNFTINSFPWRAVQIQFRFLQHGIQSLFCQWILQMVKQGCCFYFLNRRLILPIWLQRVDVALPHGGVNFNFSFHAFFIWGLIVTWGEIGTSFVSSACFFIVSSSDMTSHIVLWFWVSLRHRRRYGGAGVESLVDRSEVEPGVQLTFGLFRNGVFSFDGVSDCNGVFSFQ